MPILCYVILYNISCCSPVGGHDINYLNLSAKRIHGIQIKNHGKRNAKWYLEQLHSVRKNLDSPRRGQVDHLKTMLADECC